MTEAPKPEPLPPQSEFDPLPPGTFFDPGDRREAAEVWCALKAGMWPEHLPKQLMVMPGGKKVYVQNHMMALGAKSCMQFLGLDVLGEKLWERRIEQGRDPATGRPLYPEEKQAAEEAAQAEEAKDEEAKTEEPTSE